MLCNIEDGRSETSKLNRILGLFLEHWSRRYSGPFVAFRRDRTSSFKLQSSNIHRLRYETQNQETQIEWYILYSSTD